MRDLRFFSRASKFVERDVERVRTQRLGALQQARAPFDASEMPDVVVNQQAFVEFENGARVRPGFGIQQQLAGHSQVNREHALIEVQHDELAMPVDGFYTVDSARAAAAWGTSGALRDAKRI